MSKFKVGDKVKVIENAYGILSGSKYEINVGEYKTICNIDNQGKIQVSINGTHFFPSRFKKVARFEKVERIPQVGNKIYYKSLVQSGFSDVYEIVKIKSNTVGLLRYIAGNPQVWKCWIVKDSSALTFGEARKLLEVHPSNEDLYTWEDGTPIFPASYRKEIKFDAQTFIVTKDGVKLDGGCGNLPQEIKLSVIMEVVKALKEADCELNI